MAIPENKVEKIVEKFGVVREGNPDVYDEIARIVFTETVNWGNISDGDFAYKATVNSRSWKLRINDFPNEPMYTLFIEGKAVITFDDRPGNWSIAGE